jgi:hypothetical protein
MGDDYEVGYKKPPKSTQFKKGHSGNPKGRPHRGNKTFIDLIQKELAKEVTITEGNETQKINKLSIVIKRIAERAMKGEFKYVEMVERLTSQIKEKEDKNLHITVRKIIHTAKKDESK